MKLKERRDRNGLVVAYYEDATPEMLTFKSGDRVLPAPFWNEKKLFFTFKFHYAPGEKKSYPNGGFEIRGPNGEFRAYDSDQVILHPSVFAHKKSNEKWKKKLNKEETKRNKQLDKERRIANGEIVSGKGRPKLSETEKLKRKLEREANPTSGIRGRKKLSEEEKIEREAKKLAKRMIEGRTGKRGRPGNAEKRLQREQEQKEKRLLNPDRKRGRPKKI